MKTETSFYLEANIEWGAFGEINWLQVSTMQLRRKASFQSPTPPFSEIFVVTNSPPHSSHFQYFLLNKKYKVGDQIIH